jgi:hypothetical protein
MSNNTVGASGATSPVESWAEMNSNPELVNLASIQARTVISAFCKLSSRGFTSLCGTIDCQEKNSLRSFLALGGLHPPRQSWGFGADELRDRNKALE